MGLRTLLAARELLMLVSGRGEGARRCGRCSRAGRGRTARRRSCATTRGSRSSATRRPRRVLRPRQSWSSDRAVIVLGHREPGISAEHRISGGVARAPAARRARVPARRRRARSSSPATRRPAASRRPSRWRRSGRSPAFPALLEDAGRNTAENASRSLPIIRAIGDIRRVTVVTSAWHIRAPYFFAPVPALRPAAVLPPRLPTEAGRACLARARGTCPRCGASAAGRWPRCGSRPRSRCPRGRAGRDGGTG